MTSRRSFALALLSLSAMSLTSAVACKKTGGGSGTLRIAVIPKGTTHEFWKAVHAGAAKAAKEGNVEIVWKGPLKEDDLKAQIDVVQSFTAQGVNGIVLAPLSDKALQGSVKGAVDAKIPSKLLRTTSMSLAITPARMPPNAIMPMTTCPVPNPSRSRLRSGPSGAPEAACGGTFTLVR